MSDLTSITGTSPTAVRDQFLDTMHLCARYEVIINGRILLTLNAQAEPVIIGDTDFIERILRTNLPDGWLFHFDGDWHLGDDEDRVPIDICEHLSAEDIQNTVDTEISAIRAFRANLSRLRMPDGCSIGIYGEDHHLGLWTPEGCWMFPAVHHSMEIMELQRVTDETIRYIRDSDNVALQPMSAVEGMFDK